MSTPPAPDPRANPLHGNPLRTRADVQQAVVDLVEPLVPWISPGGARVRLGSFAAAFPQRVAELEGYARPLWGIVPLVTGGGAFAHWDRWVEGLANGTDPDHPEYWGPCGPDIDQRMVEMAAIGAALTFTPEHLWDPLTGAQRDRVIDWLRGVERGEPAPNNWQFFRLLVQMGFERVGVAVDLDARARSVALIDSYAIGGGWYSDGNGGNIDWYVPFALHTYGLLIAASGLGDRGLAARSVERAQECAPDLAHWFGPDGAAIPFGRSLTYRFAQASVWGALAAADVDALDWATVKGLALRHLRWWSDRPISDRDGVVSVGYGYDNRAMSESYNSAGSPYWCMKAFWMLAAPETHPFWTETEAAPAPPQTATLSTAGMVIGRDRSQAVALMAQPGGWPMVEQSEAKYRKLAYSSRFAFSGEFPALFGGSTTDSTLVVTDPATGTRGTRLGLVASEVTDGVALGRWCPLPGVRIDTALAGGAPWHVRVHRIETDCEVTLAETGFALPWEPAGFTFAPHDDADPGRVTGTSPWGATTIVDRRRDGAPDRIAALRTVTVNANLLSPHTLVPALDVTVGPGTHWLACAVGASDDADAVAPSKAPDVPDDLVARLEEFAAR